MTNNASRSPTARRARWIWLIVLAVVAGVVLVNVAPQPTPKTAVSSLSARGSPSSLPSLETGSRADQTRTLGADDGVIPDGATVSVFDDQTPAVSKLDPDLLDAVRRAANNARAQGVELRVTSGWRSSAYQERLLQNAVAEYGSLAKAARWVAPADTSAHVSGEAVDLGPSKSLTWPSHHGAAYGLCQTYRNEPWHYELRPDASRNGCPSMYANPTEDPRLQS